MSGQITEEVEAVNLTIWPTQMREILVKQLTEKLDLGLFNFEKSPYFKKYTWFANTSLRTRRNPLNKSLI